MKCFWTFNAVHCSSYYRLFGDLRLTAWQLRLHRSNQPTKKKKNTQQHIQNWLLWNSESKSEREYAICQKKEEEEKQELNEWKRQRKKKKKPSATEIENQK